MRAGRVAVGLGCALVALAVLLAAWIEETPALDGDDAGTVARRSLQAIGFSEVEVTADPDAREYEPATGGPGVPVWRTVAAVDGGTVELWVARSDGAAVYLLDRTEDGTGQLLTDEQFESLSEVRITPTEDRQLRRNVAATVAAGAIVLTAVGLMAATGAAEPGPSPSARPIRAARRSFHR